MDLLNPVPFLRKHSMGIFSWNSGMLAILWMRDCTLILFWRLSIPSEFVSRDFPDQCCDTHPFAWSQPCSCYLYVQTGSDTRPLIVHRTLMSNSGSHGLLFNTPKYEIPAIRFLDQRIPLSFTIGVLERWSILLLGAFIISYKGSSVLGLSLCALLIWNSIAIFEISIGDFFKKI